MKIPKHVRDALLTRADAAAYGRLCDEVSQNPRDAVGLVGAGISQERYTSWDGLLKELHAVARTVSDRRLSGDAALKLKAAGAMRDAPVRAHIYESIIGARNFRKLLANIFRSKPYGRKDEDGLAAKVARLPFRYVFTTNYDDTLIQAYKKMRIGLSARTMGPKVVDWSDSSAVSELLHRWGKPLGRWYVHLHGTAKRPHDMVLTEDDYARRYLKSDASTRTLLSLLVFRSLVCFGFSLRDADLMQILREIKSLRGNEAQHFAFLGIRRSEESSVARRRVEYLTKYGVSPIFYRVAESGSHRALGPLLEHLTYFTTNEKLKKNKASDRNRELHASLDRAWRDPLIIDDPNKFAFGGASKKPGRELSAKVSTRGRNWFQVDLILESKDPGKPLKGPVTFYTHPSFPKAYWKLKGEKLKTRQVFKTRFWAYGAFTVGAVVERENLCLELDLSELKNAPRAFRTG